MSVDAADFSRTFYPFLGGNASLAGDTVLADVRESTLQKCRDVVALRREVLDRHAEHLATAARAMARGFARGATLLAFGNGGSATDAQDLARDFLVPPVPEQRALPALCLTSDGAILTALANDVGVETVFARQVRALGRTGDIALAISTSGNSPNIAAGLEAAGRTGMLRVAILGYDGGHIRKTGLAEHLFVVPSTYIPRIQEVQATLYHTLRALVHAILASHGGQAEASP